MTGSQQPERRSQAIQAAEKEGGTEAEALLDVSRPKFGEWFVGIWASEGNPHKRGMYVRTIRRSGRMNPGVFYELTDAKGDFWQFLRESVIRAAVPPAEPQEGERHPVCQECGRIVTRRLGAWWCPVHRDEGHVILSPPVQSSPEAGNRATRTLNAYHAGRAGAGDLVDSLEAIRAALGSVREPGPRYDARVASLLDTEVQRLATLADETEGPAAERFVRQARYVAGVLDDVVERREPGPNVTEEQVENAAAAIRGEFDWGHRSHWCAEHMDDHGCKICRRWARAALEAALEGER